MLQRVCGGRRFTTGNILKSFEMIREALARLLELHRLRKKEHSEMLRPKTKFGRLSAR
jgi:hypothetical protein